VTTSAVNEGDCEPQFPYISIYQYFEAPLIPRKNNTYEHSDGGKMFSYYGRENDLLIEF